MAQSEMSVDAGGVPDPVGSLDTRGSGPLIPRVLTLLLSAAALLTIAQRIHGVSSLIAAAFMALNLIIVVFPIQHALARRLPRWVASLVAGVAALGILVGLIWSFVWGIARLIQQLPAYSGPFNAALSRLTDLADQYGLDTNQVVDMAVEQLRGISITSIVSTLSGIASSVTSGVTLLATIVLLLVFMVVDSTGFSDRMLRLGERHNPRLAWALASFARGTRKYWVVATVFGLVIAVLDWGLLVALGVPLALVWLILSFVTNYIPNVGFVLGLIPPTIMALLENGTWTAVWVVVGYWVMDTAIKTIFLPKVTGDAVGITPTTAVLSLLVWVGILGPLGALLAIPATLFVKALLIDIDPRTQWLNTFIAADPATAEHDPLLVSSWKTRTRSRRRSSTSAPE
ncbi:MAG: AI-2E family transporter [Propionibacteriaceae bacterium]|nr:AI-2E family transporter [Propionibacteriaceae bacterium]